MKEFERGARIPLTDGGAVTVERKLGAGGQGVVYLVRMGGKDMALKWYFPSRICDPVAFKDNLANNIRLGAPTASFLWPTALTRDVDRSFGYVMPLRPQTHADFSQFLLAKVRFSGAEAVIAAAKQIVGGFRALHNRGYSYQDLNDGNFFVEPRTGNVLICDNDNVAPYGKNLGIAGKCGYMAPEVVTRKKPPDIHTDRFSMAVVLYQLMFMNHPLLGKRTMAPCMTEELTTRIFGTDPLFVFDERNEANRPVPELHKNELVLWKAYPPFIRELFLRSFSREAMIGADIEHRVIEREWAEALDRLERAHVRCPACGSEMFADGTRKPRRCERCGSPLGGGLRLRMGGAEHPLRAGMKLDLPNLRAEIISSINDKNLLGMKNLSTQVWTATAPDGSQRRYEPGRTVKLTEGVKIAFAPGVEGEIQS